MPFTTNPRPRRVHTARKNSRPMPFVAHIVPCLCLKMRTWRLLNKLPILRVFSRLPSRPRPSLESPTRCHDMKRMHAILYSNNKVIWDASENFMRWPNKLRPGANNFTLFDIPRCSMNRLHTHTQTKKCHPGSTFTSSFSTFAVRQQCHKLI